MAIELTQPNTPDAVEMRQAYCDALMKAAEQDERIVLINCDMATSMGVVPFIQKFPQRSFNIGVAEANACGMAAGLAVTGFIPFFNTFSVFVSRRIYDQAYLSCAYAGLNVKLVGGDAGVSAAVNGGTHMPLEDVGIMRCIPGITLVEPADATAMAALLPQVIAHDGVCYLRMQRRKVTGVYKRGDFTLGRANVLAQGEDVAIIASGLMVAEALVAADMLKAQHISATVIDMHTIKPIDKQCIIDCARRCGALVTAENHNIINGLGSAVAEVLCENIPVPMERVGVGDQFGEVGSVPFLQQRFSLTAQCICEKAKLCIQRKQI